MLLSNFQVNLQKDLFARDTSLSLRILAEQGSMRTLMGFKGSATARVTSVLNN